MVQTRLVCRSFKRIGTSEVVTLFAACGTLDVISVLLSGKR